MRTSAVHERDRVEPDGGEPAARRPHRDDVVAHARDHARVASPDDRLHDDLDPRCRRPGEHPAHGRLHRLQVELVAPAAPGQGRFGQPRRGQLGIQIGLVLGHR